MIREEDAEDHLRDRLFFGMVKGLIDSIYYLYDGPEVGYIQLLVAARKAEMEASNMNVVMAKSGALGGSHSSEI